MANAKRDENSVPTLIGVSSVDGVTPTLVYVNPTTHRVLTDNNTTASGTVPPTSTPTAIGQWYVDTVAKKAYISMGTTSSADWIIVN